MKNIVLKLLLYLSAISIVAQTTDWVRVGPKGFALEESSNEKRTSARVNMVKFSKPSVAGGNPTIFVMTYHGIFKTIDKGDNFTPIASFNNSSWATNQGELVNDFKFTDFVVDSTNANLLIGAMVNSQVPKESMPSDYGVDNNLTRQTLIYRTLDQGANWSLINTGLSNKVTKVNKFLFSKDGTSLFACTNYGLWECSDYRSTTTLPTWVLINFPPANDSLNVVDAVFDNNAGTDYEMYVSADNTIYKKTFKSNVLSAWSDIGAALIPSLSFPKNTFYLTYTKNTLIVKVYDSVYYNNTAHKLLASQSLCSSLNKGCYGQIPTYYNLYKYSSVNSTWDLVNFIKYITGSVFPDFTRYMVARGDYFYLGRENLKRFNVNFTSSSSDEIVSVYSDLNCSANHADVMAMSINTVTNEMYVGNHGGFGVYNLNSTEPLICNRWKVVKNEGLPGGIINSVSSSPFTNGELVYNVWDNLRSYYYQIGDKHYTKSNNQYETTAPNFYIADKTFIGKDAGNDDSDVSYFNNDSSKSRTSAVFSFKSTKPNVVGSIGDYVRQAKFVMPYKEFRFFYISTNKLYFVDGLLSDNKTLNRQLKIDISLSPVYKGYKIVSLNLTPNNFVYLALMKDQTNLLIKSTDMGNTWSSVNLPSEIANVSVYGTIEEQIIFRPQANRIHKVVFDPFNKNKFYLVIGSTWVRHNMCSIYLTENSGANWTPVFYLYADIEGAASSDGYSSNGTRPPLPNNYLKGLKVNSDGILWSRFNDFDVNPNNGDPILAGEDGVYFKKDGFLSNENWSRYKKSFQPRNCNYIDINNSFNKIYVAGRGGVFCANLPCFNSDADLTINLYEDNKFYQTGGKVVCNNQVSSINSNVIYSGKSIVFNMGFKSSPTNNKSFSATVKTCTDCCMPYNDVRDYPIELKTISNQRKGNAEENEEKIEDTEIDINVYPNPSEGKSKIDFSKLKEMPLKISLVDSKGILLKEYDELEYLDEIDLTKYPTGTYLLKIEFKDSIKVKKIIKFVPTKDSKQVKDK